MQNDSGKVYLVGAGPGDSGLLTLKGLQCLRKADVVVYDHLAAVGLLAYADTHAEKLYAGKEAGAHTIPQSELNSLLVDKAKAGKTVVRLKGGDPFVFGRGGEEALALSQAGIAFEVVPGVSSAVAGPMYAGIPVTQRGVSAAVTIVTGHLDSEKEAPAKAAPGHDWQALASTGDTLVFLMGMSNLAQIVGELTTHGMDTQTPVAVIQNATTSSQRTLVSTLANVAHDVAEQGFGAPAIIVVGRVVKLRDDLHWFEDLPLFGAKVLLTRQGTQAATMAETLRDYGAECVMLPAIDTRPLPTAALTEKLGRINDYRWLVFTSRNGVAAFFEALFAFGLDARALHHLQIAVIGESTAEALRAYGLLADVLPQSFVAESLAEAMARHDLRGAKVLLPRAKIAREYLPHTLEALGAQVDVVPVYETVPAQHNLQDWRWLAEINMAAFTSSSTVTMLEDALGTENAAVLKSHAVAACIGPVTAQTARDAGYRRVIEADVFTTAALCQTIHDYWRNK